ncbi:hypothetical protein [Planotetraspora mira]|uniref:Uncharacterized protein n=1 Tax=Planotetraspora mira TaxID=58121 RepID=A0A8J3TKJ0_9ACTN|nr:hypothetical protein [Planotetraspora mira]GII26847.1 hypothetical protein Pmi06nite_02890 [Planotetraspora mira]
MKSTVLGGTGSVGVPISAADPHDKPRRMVTAVRRVTPGACRDIAGITRP